MDEISGGGDHEEMSGDDEGSLQFVPDEKSGTKKVASSIFEEQFEMRKNMLADTLKRLGYTK